MPTLADGRSWPLTTATRASYKLTRPIGVTCEEVFVVVTEASQTNVARIRLDSFGPGVPAD